MTTLLLTVSAVQQMLWSSRAGFVITASVSCLRLCIVLSLVGSSPFELDRNPLLYVLNLRCKGLNTRSLKIAQRARPVSTNDGKGGKLDL